MKLIYCPRCHDVVKLWQKDEARFCTCGASFGKYEEDGLNATIYGEAIPIGIDNFSFRRALDSRPDKGWGSGFVAFVIPKACETVREIPASQSS